MTKPLTDERLRKIEARIDDASNEQDGGLSQAILDANAVEDLLIVVAALRSERKAREAAEAAVKRLQQLCFFYIDPFTVRPEDEADVTKALMGGEAR